MEDNQIKESFKIVSVKRREKKLVKYFIELWVHVEQKVTVLTVFPSHGGGKNKDKANQKK